MQDFLDQLYDYLWGVWRYRWSGLICAWIIALVGWVWVIQIPEQYLAKAKIHVDSSSILRPLLKGLAVQPNVNQRISLMSRTLFSRPNLEKLMRMTDLDLRVTNDLEKEEVISDLFEGLTLTGVARNSSLYAIAFKHPDRDIAKKVVQSVITVVVENTLGDKRKDNALASEFLDEQIADYETRMAESEARLAEFKQRNAGLGAGETGGYFNALQASKVQLSTAKLQLQEMDNRRGELERQIEDLEEGGDDFGFSEFDNPAILSPFDSRILALEGKKDDLLMRYTERHPAVIQLDALIKELNTKREEVVTSEEAVNAGLSGNPVYQRMRALLSEAEATSAELKVRVAEYTRRVESLAEKVGSIPLIEAQLKQLNRDYGVIAKQHNTLLQRRESARLSGEVAQNASSVKFRVVDPPFVPMDPTEPDKLLLHSGVFIVAVLLGVGLALFLSLLRPVICNRRSLGQVAGLPVLGSVALIPSRVEKSRALKERFIFASLVLFLFLAFAGVNLGQSLLSA